MGLACWIGVLGWRIGLFPELSGLFSDLFPEFPGLFPGFPGLFPGLGQGYSRSQRPELARPSWRPGVGI